MNGRTYCRVVLVAALMVSACGGRVLEGYEQVDGSAGSGGSTGAGGSAGTGGSAGMSGATGTGGGAGGETGTGGGIFDAGPPPNEAGTLVDAGWNEGPMDNPCVVDCLQQSPAGWQLFLESVRPCVCHYCQPVCSTSLCSPGPAVASTPCANCALAEGGDECINLLDDCALDDHCSALLKCLISSCSF